MVCPVQCELREEDKKQTCICKHRFTTLTAFGLRFFLKAQIQKLFARITQKIHVQGTMATLGQSNDLEAVN